MLTGTRVWQAGLCTADSQHFKWPHEVAGCADNNLRVGGRTLDRAAALEHARRYLTDGKGWAYPSYDGYDASYAAGPLVDADFLAALLLNVTRISIATYEALQENRQRP